VKKESHKEAGVRAEKVREILKKCTLCPRLCKVDRIKGEKGYCGLDDKVRCFREMLHPFEENILNPSHQIYFAGCNLKCEFCTVAEWNNQPSAACEIVLRQMAMKIEQRKMQGAKTLNLLGGEPTISMHGVFELLGNISPDTCVLLNSNMYFAGELLRLLDGFVDIYLADFKCGNDGCAGKILGTENYVKVVSSNILTAARQADIIVRHLVLPGHFECCAKPIINWIASEIPNVKLSLRRDYVPPAEAIYAPKAYLDKPEYERTVDYARNLHLNLIQ